MKVKNVGIKHVFQLCNKSEYHENICFHMNLDLLTAIFTCFITVGISYFMAVWSTFGHLLCIYIFAIQERNRMKTRGGVGRGVGVGVWGWGVGVGWGVWVGGGGCVGWGCMWGIIRDICISFHTTYSNSHVQLDIMLMQQVITLSSLLIHNVLLLARFLRQQRFRHNDARSCMMQSSLNMMVAGMKSWDYVICEKKNSS